MKHLLLVLLLSLTVGCASFDKRVVWPDSAYDGPVEAAALIGYQVHHSSWKSDPQTAPNGSGANRSSVSMHIDPNPIAYCVEQTVWAAKYIQKYNKRNGTNIKPELVILTGEVVTPHSVLK